MRYIGHSIISLAILLASVATLRAQDQVTLRFTGQNQYSQYVQLSQVLVENTTKHWQEVLYHPDTTLFISTTGIEEFEQVGEKIHLFQNVPNPFEGVTDFALQLHQATNVQLEIYDINGKVMATHKASLDQGCHQFRAWLTTPQTYLLQARSNNGTVQIKLVNTGHAGKSHIEYIGEGASLSVEIPKNGPKGSTTMPFNYGDTMAYTGYAHIADRDFTSSTTVKAQYNSELIPLTFTLPLPTVTTEAASNITTTEARLNGTVWGNVEYPIVERGFLITDNSQLIGAADYAVGSGDGSFHHSVSNLQMGTQYYFRAYARTVLGITYGDILSFNTQSDLAEVHTLMVTDTGIHWANCGGNVTFDGGTPVTARGVCWSTLQNPTVNDSHTTDGNGIGSFTSHIVGLSPNTTYYVRAYATNSVGTAYGEERSFATAPSAATAPFYCGIDSVADYDGNVYHTVEIGQQCWMKENLRTTHYTDGIAIPLDTIHSSTVAYRYTPYGDSLLVLTYGYLYNWTAVMHGEPTSSSNPSEVQGICPTGWHVPSDAEWTELTDYMGTQPAYMINCNDYFLAKALSDTEGWYFTPNLYHKFTPSFDPTTNNTSGFSAQPAGTFNNSYVPSGHIACFWSATECNEGNARQRCIEFYSEYMQTICNKKEYGKSVRCLLDDSGVDSSNAVLPVVTTRTIDNIMSSTASCGGVMKASGGTPITAHGVCWSTSPIPTVNDNITVDGNNLGNFTSHISGLSANTTYYMRAYATTSMGTAYGEERNFTTTASDVSGTSHCGNDSLVTDYDGNSYSIVEIGTQCWMKENLRTTHYADGTAIPLGNLSIGFSSPYREIPGENMNDEDNLAYVPTHGFLYNWLAVMHEANSSNDSPSGVQGICPTGWHVPSDTEWMELINYMATQPAYAASNDNTHLAKALSATWGWDRTSIADAPGQNPTSNNATGFSALPTGFSNCSFGEVTSFWSCTYNADNTVHTINLNNYQAAVERSICYIADAISVRCLRD